MDATIYDPPEAYSQSDFINGVQAGEIKLRIARPGERRQIARLFDRVIDDISTSPKKKFLLDNISRVGTHFINLATRNNKAVDEYLALGAHRSDDLMLNFSLLIVAEHKGKIVGTLLGTYPEALLEGAYANVGENPSEKQKQLFFLQKGSILTLGHKLNLVSVQPDYQNNGIGKLLISFYLDIARKAGLTFIYGQCSQDLRTYYRSLGFSISDDQAAPIDISQALGYLGSVKSDSEDEYTFVSRVEEFSSAKQLLRFPEYYTKLNYDGSLQPSEQDFEWITGIPSETVPPILMIRYENLDMWEKVYGFERVEKTKDEHVNHQIILRIAGDDIAMGLPDLTLKFGDIRFPQMDVGSTTGNITADRINRKWLDLARLHGICHVWFFNQSGSNWMKGTPILTGYIAVHDDESGSSILETSKLQRLEELIANQNIQELKNTNETPTDIDVRQSAEPAHSEHKNESRSFLQRLIFWRRD